MISVWRGTSALFFRGQHYTYQPKEFGTLKYREPRHHSEIRNQKTVNAKALADAVDLLTDDTVQLNGLGQVEMSKLGQLTVC